MTAPPSGEGGDPGAVELTAPAPGFPPDIPGLTSLRFLLALGVVAFHYQLSLVPVGGSGIGVIERARLGVDVFFILSGFVLAHVYGRQYREGRYSHRRFLIARLARIYPAHIFMLGVMAIIAGCAIALGQPFKPQDYSVEGFIAAALMVHAWSPVPFPNEWNGPSWSLSAEWAAYLLFPVFAFVGLKRGRGPWNTLLLSGLLFVSLDAFYRWRYGEVLPNATLAFGVLRIVPEFLYGIGLYGLGARLTPPRPIALATAIGAGVLLLSLMQMQADERLIVVAAGPLILGLAWLSRSGSEGVLRHPWAIEAGEMSYALYLVHLPMLIVWKNVTAMLRGGDSSYLMAVWEPVVLLAITLPVAWALHRFWERPARAWIRATFLNPAQIPSQNLKGQS